VSGLPSGPVTFLFTDIEGSTRLVKALRDRYAQVLAAHQRIIRAAIAAQGGYEVDTQGDAFFAAFGSAKQAVLCALEIQRALAAHDWPDSGQVRVRIGVHTGHAVPEGGRYTGLAVHRAARICAAAAGGQVLVSQATQALIEDEEEGEGLGFALADLGEHRLKDLDRPVRLFQLSAPGLGTLAAGEQPTADLARGPVTVVPVPDAGPGAGGAAAGVHGVPVALTTFVGRAAQVEEVAGLLERHRLVTVTGPGGSGKTRLAAEVARRVAGRFADGAWLAELAQVADPAQVAPVVAAALRIRDQPGVLAAGAVARVLARQQLLLVLDNCEHVIDAAADLCAGLLGACDDVMILATSREPLAVAGETRYRLAPLALPDLDDLADAAEAEAVALFTDRARSADAHFVLDEQTGPAVARLVARLDGMPLAIELAAARVEALGVTGLLDRLGDRFALLSAGDRRAPGRQRSLAATVDWSYQLLDEHERRVFRAVSVFPAGFTLEAAEAVAGDGAGPAVLHLVDCSLLVPPRAGPDGRSRYSMLETLRAYGAARLAEAGEQDRAAAALAGYALAVAEQADAGLQTTTGELAASRWLDAEDAMMGQVLAWAMDHDAVLALRLAVALAVWWRLRGREAAEYPVLREATGRAEVGSDVWCAAQFWLAQIALSAMDLRVSLGHFTAVCDAVGDRGPSRAMAECLAGRSVALSNLGQVAEAIEEGRRSLAMAREAGYPAAEVRALLNLSIATNYAGDAGGAVQLARQAGQVPGDIPGWVARVRFYLLTSMLISAGDLAAAEEACTAGLARSREAGDLLIQARMLPLMADLDVQAGRVGDAAAHLREAARIIAQTGIWSELAGVVESCGFLSAATGRHAEAVTLLAAMEALSRSRHVAIVETAPWLPRQREIVHQARQVLGADQARAAEQRGAAMSEATAAEYVLMLTVPGSPQPQAPSGLGQLSARERELVTLVARGRTDAEIAAQLCISPATVRSRLDRIRDKTGCRHRADLTRLVLQAGLV
jgi:predicted ATPase/class 3 adenylate cyclase/DNA-binding CsgD family transcriptional regulator